MNTLNVLLPVYNARATLEPMVIEILDVLAEVSDRFELCMVDDGSTDETGEVAGELSRSYPQINLIRHPVRLGLSEAIQTGFDNSLGDFVLFRDAAYQLDPEDLLTLWQLRDTGRRLASHEHWLVSSDEKWIEKLRAWKPPGSGGRDDRGFQVIRRSTFERLRLEQAAEMVSRMDRGIAIRGLRGSPAPGPLRPNFLDRIKRFAWLE